MQGAPPTPAAASSTRARTRSQAGAVSSEGDAPLTSDQEERVAQEVFAHSAAVAPPTFDEEERNLQEALARSAAPAPLTGDEQEERDVQKALAKSAIEAAARKLAKDVLASRALFHNVKPIPNKGEGHCLIYAAVDQLRQQGIHLTMEFLRPEMAKFIADRPDYYKSFLTDCTPERWRQLLADIRYTEGPAKRWGEELEVAVLTGMFQCNIQDITSRQGDYDAMITADHDKRLARWWTQFKRANQLDASLSLKPFTLLYEEGRHWESSEQLTPSDSASAAGGAAPVAPVRSDGASLSHSCGSHQKKMAIK